MLLVEIGHSYKCFEWSPIPDSEKLGRILLWTISYSNINCLLVCPRWSTCRLLDKFLSPQFGSSFFHLFQSSLLSEAPPQLIRKTLCYHEIPVKTREGEANDATSKTWYSTYIRESGSLKQGYGIVLISHKRYVHQIYVAVSNWARSGQLGSTQEDQIKTSKARSGPFRTEFAFIQTRLELIWIFEVQ